METTVTGATLTKECSFTDFQTKFKQPHAENKPEMQRKDQPVICEEELSS